MMFKFETVAKINPSIQKGYFYYFHLCKWDFKSYFALTSEIYSI